MKKPDAVSRFNFNYKNIPFGIIYQVITLIIIKAANEMDNYIGHAYGISGSYGIH